MSGEGFTIDVLGLEIPFKAGADRQRIEEALSLIEERFDAQKQRSLGGQSKDVLLTFLALGLADDLLQSRKKLGDVQNRIDSVLLSIEKSA